MIDYEKNIIVTKSIAFSLMIMKYCDLLYQDRRFVIANQLLRSSTSIGANIIEAQHAVKVMGLTGNMNKTWRR